MQHPRLPLETIASILKWLPPDLCFRVAVSLRMTYLYRHCIPSMKGMSLNNAMERECQGLIDWWVGSRIPIELPWFDIQWMFQLASGLGQLSVLELIRHKLFADAGHVFVIPFAMDDASQKGHVSVLEWWKQTGLVLVCPSFAITDAATNGHVAVLEWWKGSGVRMDCNPELMYHLASVGGHVNVLQWCKDAGLSQPDPVTDTTLILAGSHGHVHVLEWWRQNSGQPLVCPSLAFEPHINAEDWWKRQTSRNKDL